MFVWLIVTKHTPKCHLCAVSAVKGSELHSLRKAVLTALNCSLSTKTQQLSCLEGSCQTLRVCVCVLLGREGE